MSRTPIVVGLLAAALLAPVVPASAAWQSQGNGSGLAKASTLGAPSPSFGTAVCSGSGASRQADVPLSWAAVTNAASYDVTWSTALTGTKNVSTSNTSTTLTAVGLNGNDKTQTFTAKVRSTRNNWHSPFSSQISVTVTC